jgi:hypothetical protein
MATAIKVEIVKIEALRIRYFRSTSLWMTLFNANSAIGGRTSSV